MPEPGDRLSQDSEAWGMLEISMLESGTGETGFSLSVHGPLTFSFYLVFLGLFHELPKSCKFHELPEPWKHHTSLLKDIFQF